MAKLDAKVAVMAGRAAMGMATASSNSIQEWGQMAGLLMAYIAMCTATWFVFIDDVRAAWAKMTSGRAISRYEMTVRTEGAFQISGKVFHGCVVIKNDGRRKLIAREGRLEVFNNSHHYRRMGDEALKYYSLPSWSLPPMGGEIKLDTTKDAPMNWQEGDDLRVVYVITKGRSNGCFDVKCHEEFHLQGK